MNGTTEVTIHDVAAFIYDYMNVQHMTQMTLYKLLWFCQGWHCRFTGKFLFQETFEARELGPVPPVLWNELQGKPRVYREKFNIKGNPAKITNESSKFIIRKVVDLYGKFPPYVLSAFSHQCDPWRNNFDIDDKTKTIPNDEIHDYFSNLTISKKG